ncbi:Aldo/keto reductase [Russula dissimulans]|nr:Aldo/keto reductase [Russula dissimulans]
MIPTRRLNDGNEQQLFTSSSRHRLQDVTEWVKQALDAGFSHIDTAAFYANEQFVGAAIRGHVRKGIWITTKYGSGNALEEVHTSLRKLGLRHLDLYLIHSPWNITEDDVEGLWDEMIKIREAGLTRSIGVSNFTLRWLQRIVKTGKVVPAVNQIHLHPYNYASWKDVLDFSEKHGIVTEAYGSLAPITTFPGGPVDIVLATIGRRIGGTPAQVIFKWVHAKGFVVVTTTARRTRLDDYLRVVELPDLTPEEVEAIDEAGLEGPPEPASV